ncbi:hypothetical protein MMC10_005005 [Thelotrema lepadinum]|nr:hypothetical protein [Thelotrema lepadinum]
MSTALINATPLAPEVALKKALADYEIVLTDEQRDVFRKTSSPQPSDLFNLTAEIERQAENRKSRRYMGPRLLDILQAVQRFSTLVDLVVGGSQSITAGSIWGAVKLALQVSRAYGTMSHPTSNTSSTLARNKLWYLLGRAFTAFHAHWPLLPSL